MILDPKEAERLLEKAVPFPKNYIIKDKKDLGRAERLGFPLVLKIISPEVMHKTDIDGVRIVNERSKLKKEFEKLIKTAKKRRIRLKGILAQEFTEGYEFIIGIKRDKVFGHSLLLGAGGIFTEIYNDKTIRICPVSEKDAAEMLEELKFLKALRSRGKKLNLNSVKKAIVNISKIAEKNMGISELDINPLIVNERKAVAVDVRVISD
jgi:hypothetical protein